ncbi:hypothetical protein B0H14DRAFT_1549971 [Mycena olivaceomarginata]|nr:hypothetical protein B0H14DRAFT_1549971 [Mycena olivaceomarginata]
MPKSQKEETLSTLASRIFSAMLEDIVMDVTLQSHHETARSRTVCSVCKTRCSSVHAPTHSVASLPSRASTPAANGSASTGTSTPTKSDGNLYLECLHCSRQIASNRYAPHLSSCMGLSQSRRGAARGSAAKSKQPSEARSTGSPEATLSDDGGSPNKGKGKAKGKTDVNLKRKRPESPQLTPNKKQKKQSASGSPVSRIKAGSDVSGIPASLAVQSALQAQRLVYSLAGREIRDAFFSLFFSCAGQPRIFFLFTSKSQHHRQRTQREPHKESQRQQTSAYRPTQTVPASTGCRRLSS